MKLLNYLISSTLILLFASCGSDNGDESEPVVTETFSCVVVTPQYNDIPPSIFEEFSAAQVAKWIPCDVTNGSKEETFDKGGSVSYEYTLTLNKWRDANLTVDSLWVKDFAVHSVEYTTYTFTPGIYDVEADGRTIKLAVNQDYIAIVNPYTGEDMNPLLSLNDCQRTYSTISENPVRAYQEKETKTYSKPFALVKLADDHFYIENDDYTFEGYINAQGVMLNQIKPEEEEIGQLYR